MSEQELTPWFPGDVKPVRVGLYQREWDLAANLNDPDYWDGKQWRYNGPGGWRAGRQDRRWRGLASDPAKRAVRGGK